MIDRNHIGLELASHSVEVEKGRLRFFAKATGQSEAIYLDEYVAKAAGYPTLPAPPTFLFSLEMEKPDPFEMFFTMGIDLKRVLHGEQSFKHHKPVCAGDTITFTSKVEDIFDKKGGTLEFVVQKTLAKNQHDEAVGEMTRLIVVRN
ncbi:MAG: MaoC family dehydratase N-terminal domain-containing protein [Hyphomicrobiales bacterium]